MNELLLALVIIVVVCFAFVCFIGSPFVPTRKKWAEEALKLIKLNKDDIVVDLGAGNGKILRLLSEKEIKSIGYEINPILVVLAKVHLFRNKYAKIKIKNYWKIDLPKQTTVVYAFMVERDAKKLEEYLSQQAKMVNTAELKLITFGFSLPNQKPVKRTSSSSLYIFE